MANVTVLSQHVCFGGRQLFVGHESSSCNAPMRFSIYLPPASDLGQVPAVMCLAGLTCTEETFATKAGAQRWAAECGLALIMPDTSPRGLNLPGDSDHWDFGVGAGFYVDATEPPWSQHYRMYRYVTQELVDLVAAEFPIRKEKLGILGHSMGGHGALVCGLRNPDVFQSISAFAPVVAPMVCPWGQKAFSHYLGKERESWRHWDACELVRSGISTNAEILVDVGLADKFLTTQLMPEKLEEVCARSGQSLKLRRHAGYDHSYYFITTFVEDHLRHHARYLN